MDFLRGVHMRKMSVGTALGMLVAVCAGTPGAAVTASRTAPAATAVEQVKMQEVQGDH